ncbi:MAG TPA: AI-2E family transporter [Geothermobacteraceae bacterium]|nr:AI-2E family transporter [Geothermobacteraceae bacterium]
MAVNGQKRGAVPLLLSLAAVVVVIAGVREAAELLIPFLLAIFIAVICAPSVFWLQRKKIPRWVAVLLVVLVLWGVVLGMATLLGTSVNSFTRAMPAYQASLEKEFTHLLEWLNGFGLHVPTASIQEQIDPGAAMRLARGVLTSLGGVLTNTFLIMVTVIFILLEAASFPVKLRSAFGQSDTTMDAFGTFAGGVNRYLAIKSLMSLVTGLGVWLLLTLVGVDFPVLWGLLAFLLNYVPTIGSIIAAVPAVLLALIQFGGPKGLVVAVGYLVINLAIANFIEPQMMGRGVGLSTLVVFLSLVFWGWVFGPIGMLLSVPLTMTAKIALGTSEKSRWLAIMLGPEIPPETSEG